MELELSKPDYSFVHRALGREPTGAEEVVARCPVGHPLAIRVKSIVKGRPFPTLFWLTCPHVSKQIDALEASGLIKELEQEIADSIPLANHIRLDHMRHAALREKTLIDEERDALRDLGMLEEFNAKGIGGVADLNRLRCLHMHFAAHQVIPNWVGSRMESHGIKLCTNEDSEF